MKVKREGTLINAAKLSVKVEDVYTLKDLYKLVKEWLDEEFYFDEYGGEKYREKLYVEKSSKGVTEHWMWWRTIKYPEGVKEKTGYVRYLLDIDYHTLGMSKVEVMHKGKKLKMDKGEVEVMINANLELDYRGEWEKHGFLKNLISLFQRRIYKKEIEHHKLALYREAFRLQEIIKRYLEVKGLTTMEELKTYVGRSLV